MFLIRVAAANTYSTNRSIIYYPSKALSLPGVSQTESYQQSCFDLKLLFSQRVFLNSPGPAMRTGETCRTVCEQKKLQKQPVLIIGAVGPLLTFCQQLWNYSFFRSGKKKKRNNHSFIFSSKSSRNSDMTFRGMLQEMGEIMGPLKQWINGGNVFSYIIHHPDKICTCSVRE